MVVVVVSGMSFIFSLSIEIICTDLGLLHFKGWQVDGEIFDLDDPLPFRIIIKLYKSN